MECSVTVEGSWSGRWWLLRRREKGRSWYEREADRGRVHPLRGIPQFYVGSVPGETTGDKEQTVTQQYCSI